MAILTKIDSNQTGLRYAEESSYKILRPTGLGANGVNAYSVVSWEPLEPNSYTDFGGQITTIARNPINPSRQRKKGVTTDLDASGGFDSDLTQSNLQDILQGLFFAKLRRKPETFKRGILNSQAAIPITSVVTSLDTYTLANLGATSVDTVAAGGSGYTVGDTITLAGGTFATATVLEVTTVSTGAVTAAIIVNPGRYSVAPADPVAQGSTSGGGTGATFNMTYAAVITFVDESLIFASGFTNTANNGLKHVTSLTSTTLVVAENLVNETPTSAAKITTVGVVGAAGDIDVDASGTYPRLTSTSLDFTTLGLTPGEWIFVGGDTAGTFFTNVSNNGYARVRTIAANSLTLDKTTGTMVTEASTTETIHIYFGRVLKNELGSNIVRTSYELERTLGAPDTTLPSSNQAEYLESFVVGEVSFNVATANKLTTSIAGVAASHTQNSVADGLKAGDRPSLSEMAAYNTSSDFTRIKMALVTAGVPDPVALFAFLTDLTITINNNLTPNKAVGTLGAFEVTAGTFAVSGELTAYFSEVSAIQAVQENEDVTLDFHLFSSNSGISFDLPLVALGNGRANIEQDQPITLPLSMDAATAAKIDPALDYTFLMDFFDYLPELADSAA
jgi:hypothetical protein